MSSVTPYLALNSKLNLSPLGCKGNLRHIVKSYIDPLMPG